ncbi:MAG: iron-sulfur cluster assembly protein [Candidatus Aenigmarchaeota archaeon]|nr:iron-sulfur cluster assembly protein [Candidatus Aenigmarchaeota archaeon]
MKNVSEKDVKEVLSKVIHPEINYSLVELGMIKDIKVEDNVISITLTLPFLDVPIKEDLINLVKEALKSLNNDMEIKMNIAEMDEEERERFMILARKGWKV